MASKKKRGGGRGKTVRRRDKNGHTYFAERQSGRRVSRDVWEREQSRLRAARERERIAREQESKRKPSKPRKPSVSSPSPPPTPPPIPPFPPDVSDIGYPIDDDGEFLDEAFAIEGEDET